MEKAESSVCGHLLGILRDQQESRKNLDLDNFSLILSSLGLNKLENYSLCRVLITTMFKSESRANLDLNNFQINNLGIEIFQKTYQIMSHFENIGRS